MKIIDLNNGSNKYETAIVLGNFDGVHKGHQYLINDTIKKANKRNLKPSILLFKNHTRTITNSKRNVAILTNNEQKMQILRELGIKIVYTIEFDESIMKLSGEEFVKSILVNKLNAKLITIGFDYRFGHKASGDSNYLKELGKKYDFETNIIKPIYINGGLVSSTRIRQLIQAGEIKKAKGILGRAYGLKGRVIKGSQRGSKLGYPTANIELLDNYIIPKMGVYASATIVDSEKFLSLTNIGYNPTFNGESLKIENHILDFNKNIYGQNIEIQFIDFIREDVKFKTAQELIKQIELDVNYIKETKNIYN